jgi:FixJ family two-component response regulator
MGSAATFATLTRSARNPIDAIGRDLILQATATDAPTVFVIDDDIDDRLSLEALIRSEGWQPESCDSVEDLLSRPRPSVPNTLILAFSNRVSNGLEVQRRIAREWAEMPVVVTSDYEDIRTTVEAMKAGAVDFLLKPCSGELLMAAIRQCLGRSRAALNRAREMHDLRSCYASLTAREEQVMALVVCGLLNKQVGAELGISEITVKAHRGRVMQKMSATSLAQLVNMASKLRIRKPLTSSALFV